MRLGVRVSTALVLLLLSCPPGGANAQAPPGLANPGLLRSLSPAMRAALTRNGFVAAAPLSGKSSHSGPYHRWQLQQFYSVYEQNWSSAIPSFITSDALLHIFHVMYDKTLVAMERTLLAPKLEHLSAGLVTTAAYQYGATRDPGLREAARIDLGYAAVAQSLLDPHARVPATVAPQVRAELSLIAAHRGYARSPLFGSQVDYSQFVPRGHYTITPSLQRYFRAMMWYGRVAFHLNGPTARAETRQALLLVRAVTMVPGLNALWSAVFDPATAWVGRSDDLTLRDYARVMTAVYGRNAPLSALTNRGTLARFISRANALPNPQVIADPTQSSASGARATKGMRLFPQRFTPDASIMQGLIWNQVGTAQHRRLWPMGLDVAAALGSSRATSLLTGPLHQNTYARYTQRLSAFRRYYASRPPASWTQNLYVRWLNTLQSVWSPPPSGAPQFMRTTAWSDKEVATGLGSWAELKHDTILYAKQPAGLGSGGVRPAFRTAYVEPVPAVYAKLSSLVSAFKSTLAREGLLDHLPQSAMTLTPGQTYLDPAPPRGEGGYRAAIDSFAALVALCDRAARQELAGQPISGADAHTLWTVGTELEQLTTFFIENAVGGFVDFNRRQVAAIADVFTEPGSGQVLEEGVGDVLPAYAVVSIGGKRWLAAGGIFSYYEFHQAMSDRLTDEAWWAMTSRPAQPGWTASYIAH